MVCIGREGWQEYFKKGVVEMVQDLCSQISRFLATFLLKLSATFLLMQNFWKHVKKLLNKLIMLCLMGSLKMFGAF